MPHVLSLFDLTGKVFLVVGGARNLGNDLATALAEGGADGMLTSRTQESAQEAAQALAKATGKRVVGSALDANDENEIQAVIADCLKQFGKIDILINNVGGGAGARAGASAMLETRDLDQWENMQKLWIGNIIRVLRLQAKYRRRGARCQRPANRACGFVRASSASASSFWG